MRFEYSYIMFFVTDNVTRCTLHACRQTLASSFSLALCFAVCCIMTLISVLSFLGTIITVEYLGTIEILSDNPHRPIVPRYPFLKVKGKMSKVTTE